MAGLVLQSLPISGHRQSCFLGSPVTLQSCPNRIHRLSRGPIQAGIIGPGKRWEHYKLNHNKKPIRHDVHVRSGDTVVVIGGKDKGKVGKVDKVMPKTAQIVVEGVNLRLKFRPPMSEDDQGSYFQKESPIHHSNVMHWSSTQNVRSRLAHRLDDAGKKVRYLVKTGEVIPNVIKPKKQKGARLPWLPADLVPHTTATPSALTGSSPTPMEPLPANSSATLPRGSKPPAANASTLPLTQPTVEPAATLALRHTLAERPSVSAARAATLAARASHPCPAELQPAHEQLDVLPGASALYLEGGMAVNTRQQ